MGQLTPMQLLYRVIFSGSTTGEFELAECKKRFSALFKLDAQRTEKYFSGSEIVLKKNVTEDQAMDYAIRVMEAGCECIVEPMPDPGDLSLQPGFKEQRKVVRRKRFRRPPRPGAIVPDRRALPSRRKLDLVMLEKYGDFPGKTVGPRS